MTRLDQEFRGKNILLSCVKFFGYEKEIKKKLESFGALVVFIDERPNNSFLTKSIIRIKKSVVRIWIQDYYRGILKQIIDSKFDYYLVIRGEVIPPFFVRELRKLNPDCCFIFYNWDSFSNCSNSLQYLDEFDRVFSFDADDAQKYGIGFRPLFCLDEYLEIRENAKVLEEYDLLFIGTAHMDRYAIAKKIECILIENQLNMYLYFYLQHPMVFYYKRFFEKNFEGVKKMDMDYHNLGQKEILGLYEKSKVILDIQHPYQTGLTMRTFEALGARKKLITTNSGIKNYPFYNAKNIQIIDRQNVKLDMELFQSRFEPMDKDMIYYISLSGWLEDVFLRPYKN